MQLAIFSWMIRSSDSITLCFTCKSPGSDDITLSPTAGSHSSSFDLGIRLAVDIG